ncbi:MBOAT, membrane-bound O-acyltransferase family-domain-containing protein [Hyaloraphidium curvatum]|nr:MBOAT, membrane-bound O-acyltransferase family-domain-containing protein [Hyaloraphidium curvatum]
MTDLPAYASVSIPPPSPPSPSRGEMAPPPPRWHTAEMRAYVVAVVVAVASMLAIGAGMSSSELENYANYDRFLSRGWLGRPIDNSDIQFRGFRNNIPYLAVAMAAHLLLGRVFVKRRSAASASGRPKDTPSTPKAAEGAGPGPPAGADAEEAATAASESFANYNIAFGLLFLVVLHGFSTLKIVGEIGLNYAIARRFRGSVLNPVLTWTLALVLLWWNERGGAQTYGSLVPFLGFLDSFKGLLPRWFITFNLSILRMISFNMDYYWCLNGAEDAFAAHKKGCAACREATTKAARCERGRTDQPLEPEDYSLLNYLCYTLYTPLFLAGPIMTFNDFVSQVRHPLPSTSLPEVARYSARWVLNLLVMEVMLHYIYAVAMIRAKAYDLLTPAQVGMLGYFNLKYIWLKLLLIWRFFRMWSLADGIDPPENMHRCMSNNYSAAGFWRSWHRSYNRWLIRYMYVPLGGSKRRLLSMPVIFTFVGFWHDRSFTLLAWAWLIILFLLPEGLATAYFGTPKWTSWKYYRYLAGLGGVANILMMMVANLVGFAVGVDGIKKMLSQLLTIEGIAFFLGTFVALFSAVQIMFEIRADEDRSGEKTRF